MSSWKRGIVMRLLLDTNVILNGVFVPGSRSRLVLEHHLGGTLTAFVSDDIMKEAASVLDEAKRKTGKDLWMDFKGALESGGIKVVSGVSDQIASSYSGIRGMGDRKVVAAAQREGLTVVTNNLRDYEHSDRYGVQIASPEEITISEKEPLRDIVRGFLGTQCRGTFLAEVDAMWAQTEFPADLEKRFYLFDAELLGSLYYNNSDRSIVFEGQYHQLVRLALPPISELERPIGIAVTYDCTRGVVLYQGYRGKKSTWQGQWTPASGRVRATIHVGSDRHVDNHLNGQLYTLASYPRPMTEKAVNNLLAQKRTREPLERLSLQEVVERWYH